MAQLEARSYNTPNKNNLLHLMHCRLILLQGHPSKRVRRPLQIWLQEQASQLALRELPGDNESSQTINLC